MTAPTDIPPESSPGPRMKPSPSRLIHNGQPQPTVATLTTFLRSFFPPDPPTPPPHSDATSHEATPNASSKPDVPFLYHKPLHPPINPATQATSSVVLSITPTEAFYTALHRHRAQVAFLHRPFGLDRRRVPRTATVLASHKGLDEVLTVGFNVPLARRLGMEVGDGGVAGMVKGYKGDAERRVGIVGKLREELPAQEVRARVLAEFDGECEGVFGFVDQGEGDCRIGGVDDRICAIAIMNAFNPELIERVVSTAVDMGLIASAGEARNLLYLTGAVRESGQKAAGERDVKVICVGHRACEEWGVRYLASRVREEFPSLHVEEVYEAEEMPPKRTTEGRRAPPNTSRKIRTEA